MSPGQDDLRQRDRLRVGIVGCGGIGNSHARAYLANPQGELVGVVDVIAERAEAYARDYATTAYGSIGELADQQPDRWPPRRAITWDRRWSCCSAVGRCCWRSRPPPTWWIWTR